MGEVIKGFFDKNKEKERTEEGQLNYSIRKFFENEEIILEKFLLI